jgi:hypothetical protein
LGRLEIESWELRWNLEVGRWEFVPAAPIGRA